MLRLAVVTPNPVAADAIEMLTMESGAFMPCYKVTPVPHHKEIIRTLTVQNPAIVLLDLGDWIEAAGIADYQQLISKGLTGMLLQWKQIDAIEKLVQSPNSKTIVLDVGKVNFPMILDTKNLETEYQPNSGGKVH